VTDASPLLELRGITKRFGSLVANNAIDLDVRAGEVHALLGENGAGKSTLMNVLYGLYAADAGEILMDGKPLRLRSPRDAIDAGIGMVHQHFMLIPVMTVAENIVLAHEPHHGVLMDYPKARQEVRELSDRYGLAVSPDDRVEEIGVAQQQRVEILKALFRSARVLILDEPTAVLTPQEAEELFRVVRSLKEQGTGIIFISHKLNEVLEIADRITVLRRGQAVATRAAAGATEEGLAELMVGRAVLLDVDKQPANPGEPLLTVSDLVVHDVRGLEAVRGLSLEVRAGEIVGIAGVDGNGQTELVEAITGLTQPEHGSITVAGREVAGRGAHASYQAGVGHIPEDRQRFGLVLDFSLAENLALHEYRTAPESTAGLLWPRRLIARARKLLSEFDVRGGQPQTVARALSGGNQQKVVIAREVSGERRVLVAAQPTRGLDVGAIEFVHRRLVAERDAGHAILLVSFELDEILSLSDRILVIYEGRIVAEHLPGVTEAELGIEMTGGHREAVG
jgi:general nucleoside transport system ATP-binding protein